MAKRRNYAARNGGGVYRYTPKRKAALRRAQAISARKRRGKKSNVMRNVVITSTLVGAGAAAVYGYQNRSKIRAASDSWKAAVQPGSKERLRIANALGGNQVAAPTKKAAPTKGAAKKTNLDVVPGRPNGYNGEVTAFPKQAKDVEVANKLIEGSDRPYNIDRFLPKGTKGLIFGKRVTGNAASRAVAEHAANAGKIKKHDVDASGILHDMVADGSVSRVVLGKENKRRKAQGRDPLPTPKSGRVGVTRKPKAKQTLESKAFEQWLRDFGD